MVRWPTAPTPSAPQVNLSGLALASAMNSWMFFAGISGLMPTATGTVPKFEIGVKSFTTSYCVFISIGVMTNSDGLTSSV